LKSKKENIPKRDCDARQNRDNKSRSLFHIFLTIIAADKSIYDAEHINHDITQTSAQSSKCDLATTTIVQSYANSLAIPAPINILLSTSVVFSGENHIRGGYGNCPEYESYGNNSPDKNNFHSKNYLFHYSRNSFYNKSYNNKKATLTTVGTIKISQQQSPKQQMPQSKHTPQQQSQKQQMPQSKHTPQQSQKQQMPQSKHTPQQSQKTADVTRKVTTKQMSQ
jgi:hypothetical protein